MADLTPLQAAFVREYAANPLDGAAAYVRAGGSKGRAKQGAYAMLKLPQVADAVKALAAKADAGAIDARRAHLNKLAELRDEAAKCGQYGAAITAETNRGKVEGHYTDKTEHSGSVEFRGVIEVVKNAS